MGGSGEYNLEDCDENEEAVILKVDSSVDNVTLAVEKSIEKYDTVVG